MTTTEFKNEFDILYNSVTSNTAPPLDGYEVSVFLTQGQERLIKNYYNPLGNKYQEGFDRSEKRKRELASLVSTDINSSPITSNNDSINGNSRFFELQDNVMFIVQESVILSSIDSCLKNRVVDVVPVTYDEYNRQRKNPFKKPNKDTAWRLDYKNINDKKVVEIITVTDSTAGTYKYKYIKYPKPIIVSTLTSETINGLSAITECELPESIHREIVDIAVELALEAIGSPRLQSKIALDSKTE